MREALEIIKRLLSGEKLTFNGKFYQTNSARLYSPAKWKVGIYMAAGGEKSAKLAAKQTDGVIVSVKGPDDALIRVINPARDGNPNTKIISSRWSILAKNKSEAFEAIKPWRGLRVEDRLNEVDPEALRVRADQLSQEEILSSYLIASNPGELIEIYKPLIIQLKSDIVVVQLTSIDQEKTIEVLGKEVVPELRKLGEGSK